MHFNKSRFSRMTALMLVFALCICVIPVNVTALDSTSNNAVFANTARPAAAYPGDNRVYTPSNHSRINDKLNGTATYAYQNEAESTKAVLSMLLGDVNYDIRVNTGDAVMILRFCASIVSFDAVQLKVADVNLDNKNNTGDAVHLLRMCAGLIPPFGYTDIEVPDEDVQYTVTYMPGTTYTVSSLPLQATVTSGDVYTVPAKQPTSDEPNVVFDGYASSVPGSTLLMPGATFMMPAYDVTLTATWKNVGGTPTPTPGTPTPTPGTPTPTPTTPAGDAVVTFNYTDAFNETVVGTKEVEVSQNTIFTAANVPVPEGYKVFGSLSANVTVNGTTASPATVNVSLYKFTVDESNVEFTMINNPAGLDNMRLDMARNYKLEGNIDMNHEVFKPIGWQDSGDDVEFTGIIDGGLFAVYNYNCDWDYYSPEGTTASNVGFVAVNAGTIRHLIILADSYTDGAVTWGVYGYYNVGIIAGRNIEGAVIEDCHVSGNVGALDLEDLNRGGAGSISGQNSGTISRCSSVADVEGFYWAGGITGKNFGTISETWWTGGINSAVTEENIERYSIRYIGGLAGGTVGTIRNCYVFCLDYVCGDMCVGGIAGWAKGGTVDCFYGVNITSAIFALYGGGASAIGSHVDGYPPTLNYCYELSTDNTALPTGFDDKLWNMDDTLEGYEPFPDLTNNARARIWG